MRPITILLIAVLIPLTRIIVPAAEISGESKTAVYVQPIKLSSSQNDDARVLHNCLLTHLDYYLWQKAINFDFIRRDSTGNMDEIKQDAQKRHYDRLLFITPKAELKLKKTLLPGRTGREKSYGFVYILNIKIDVGYFDLSNAAATGKASSFQARTSDHWVEMNDSASADQKIPIIEPPDYVIKRLLSEALTFIPPGNYSPPPPADRIPIYLAVDSRIHNDWQSGGDTYLIKAVEYASRALEKQFGFGLQLIDKEFITIPVVPFSRIEALFKSFAESEPHRLDTLAVGVFRPERSGEFFEKGRNVQIGISDIGKRVSLVAELLPPGPPTAEWKVFLNGQLLLHEIGHLLGAIHVSDIQSIMISTTAWASSERFDPLNHEIILLGHQDRQNLSTVSKYLDLLVNSLETTGYKLADYPAVFFSFMNINRNTVLGDNFGTDAFRRSIPFAAQGYMQLMRKNNAFAEELLYRALAGDTGQGSIHYYLSKATFGELSRYHLLTAARIGYYQAVQDTLLLKKK
jgi:hypothetical protein